LFVLVAPSLLGAQSPACQEQVSAVSPEAQRSKITIVGVTFRGENPLSEEERAQLTKEIRHAKIDASKGDPDKDWVNKLEELTVRETMMEHGYFRALVEIRPYLVRAEAHERCYAIDVVIESGPQYRLGEIQIVGATALSATDLRKQIMLSEGEIFDASKIREGLEAISRLYGAKGYIDTTIEPEEKIDETQLRIDLVLKVAEEQQYRIGSVELLGLDAKIEADARSVFQWGQVFDTSLWREFLGRVKSALPDGMPDRHTSIRRDTSSGTVNISLDFRGCPQAGSK
jgi:outer membrane translocation and assembly module TamA